MLQYLGDCIAKCLQRATAAEQRAAQATDPKWRIDNELTAASWRRLARCVESLERSLLSAERLKAVHRKPPTK
jgi:hypothetical protein